MVTIHLHFGFGHVTNETFPSAGAWQIGQKATHLPPVRFPL